MMTNALLKFTNRNSYHDPPNVVNVLLKVTNNHSHSYPSQHVTCSMTEKFKKVRECIWGEQGRWHIRDKVGCLEEVKNVLKTNKTLKILKRWSVVASKE